jgi:hypothetical protein
VNESAGEVGGFSAVDHADIRGLAELRRLWLPEEYYSSSIPAWLRALKSFPSACPASSPSLPAGAPVAAACHPSSLKQSLANSNEKRSVSSWTSSTKPSGLFLKLNYVA